MNPLVDKNNSPRVNEYVLTLEEYGTIKYSQTLDANGEVVKEEVFGDDREELTSFELLEQIRKIVKENEA